MWSYDPTNLSTDTTTTGAINAIRLLIGDTDTTDQLVEDEEISFAITAATGGIYKPAAFLCRVIAGKFARQVDTQLDSRIVQEYLSQRVKQYLDLAVQIEQQGKKVSGKYFGLYAGGISKSTIDGVENLTDRPQSAFYKGQFSNPYARKKYLPDGM